MFVRPNILDVNFGAVPANKAPECDIGMRWFIAVAVYAEFVVSISLQEVCEQYCDGRWLLNSESLNLRVEWLH